VFPVRAPGFYDFLRVVLRFIFIGDVILPGSRAENYEGSARKKSARGNGKITVPLALCNSRGNYSARFPAQQIATTSVSRSAPRHEPLITDRAPIRSSATIIIVIVIIIAY